MCWIRCQFLSMIWERIFALSTDGSGLFALIHSGAAPLLRISLSRHLSLPRWDIQPISINLAHNVGVSSIKLRQFRHTCDVKRVVRRAYWSANMSAFIVNIDNSMSLLRLWMGVDDGFTGILDKMIDLRDGKWAKGCRVVVHVFQHDHVRSIFKIECTAENAPRPCCRISMCMCTRDRSSRIIL